METANINNYTKTNIIPLSQVPSQQFEIVLNNQNCRFFVYQKDESVYVDLYVDDVLIFGGMRALDRQGLKIAEYLAFSGQVWFEDLNGTENPNYKGFGERWLFYYGN